MAIWFFTESVAYQEAEKLSKRHGKEVISRPATITIEVKE
jgi:hypothetical protein